MCEENPGYTTIVGPQWQLRNLMDQWDRLQIEQGYEQLFPTLLDLSDVDPTLREDDVPGVAVIWHDPELGYRVANRLQADLLARRMHAEALICEPGFTVHAASPPLPGGAMVSLLPDKVRAGHTLTHAVDSRPRRKVALLDSGDNLATVPSVVFSGTGVHSVEDQPDVYGHGTAIADIIRSGVPDAEIVPINIFDGADGAYSFHVFGGLIYALWSQERFGVVNASIVTNKLSACASSVGRTISYIDAMSRANQRLSQPLVVAAGGNAPASTRMGYPAMLPSAVAVEAVEWDGRTPCDYNVRDVGSHPRVATAPGGSARDPIGHVNSADGQEWDIWGTSFAAAFVTASALT